VDPPDCRLPARRRLIVRVLFCSTGGTGHLRPMLPLATALRRRGHHLAWATSPDALPALHDNGFELFAAGPDMPAARRAYRQRWPQATTLAAQARAAHTFPRLFGDVIAHAMLDPLAAIVDRWQPDMVIGEPAALAAPLVCAQRRIPNPTHAYGLRVPHALLASAMQAFGPRWRAAGLAPPADGGLYRTAYVDIAPPSLQGPVDSVEGPVLRLRPASAGAGRDRHRSPVSRADADSGADPIDPADEGAPAPARAHSIPAHLRTALAHGTRPRVYLTFGTVFNDSAPLRQAAAALATLDAVVVVTVGADGDPASLDGLPPRVHVERFVDQQALLPWCDAVVSHGGAGTVLGAAAHGLPQLLLPQAADQFRNSAALARVGAGRALPTGDRSQAAIAHALADVLASIPMRDAACRIAREIAAMPDADTVAARLEHV